MPFPTQNGLAFIRGSIENLGPNQNGCYGLYNANAWVYVGKGDIRQRLLDHLNGDNPRITACGPTHFYTVVCADMDEREKALIVEYDPIANRRVG